jgi:hypothetical protein
MAGRFFRALAELFDDLGRRTLSRKPIWHLFSGEELELWLLKTILGFFHAGVLSKDGRKIGDVQTVMNPAIETALSHRPSYKAVRHLRAQGRDVIGPAGQP